MRNGLVGARVAEHRGTWKCGNCGSITGVESPECANGLKCRALRPVEFEPDALVVVAKTALAQMEQREDGVWQARPPSAEYTPSWWPAMLRATTGAGAMNPRMAKALVVGLKDMVAGRKPQTAIGHTAKGWIMGWVTEKEWALEGEEWEGSEG